MTNVSFSASGPPETILPDPDPEIVGAMAGADPDEIHSAAARFPEAPLVWAELGDLAVTAGMEPITAYAYYRVGYHRGLDLLRQHGWKGSGFVRDRHPGNRGFLRCLRGLAGQADLIGETHEAERCRQFLVQLDPDTAT